MLVLQYVKLKRRLSHRKDLVKYLEVISIIYGVLIYSFLFLVVEKEIVQHNDIYTTNQAAPTGYASSATKELDDLMASLSDFKVNFNTLVITLLNFLKLSTNCFAQFFQWILLML